MSRKAVRTTMNYTLDNGRTPNFYFYEPEPDEEIHPNPAGTDAREIEVEDGWGEVDSFDPDRQGFALKNFEEKFSAFNDETEVTTTFYEQIIAFVKKIQAQNGLRFSTIQSAAECRTT